MIPFYDLKGRWTRTNTGLTVTRMMFLCLVFSLPLYVIAFSFIAPWDAGEDGVGPYLVIAVGLMDIAICRHVGRRPLDGSSPTRLAGSYRTRMFIGIGFAEIPALLAIGASFVVSNSLWIIALGAGFSLLCISMVAPSRRNLAHDQEGLRELGSSLDLVTILDAAAPPASGGSR